MYALVAVTRRDDLVSFISDTYKDAHGFRPRHYDWNAMSIAELEKLADEVSKDANESFQLQKEEQNRAVASFEEQITKNIDLGAKDRNTAIRWIVESYSERCGDDMAFVCYCLNIPYEMKSVLQEAMDADK